MAIMILKAILYVICALAALYNSVTWLIDIFKFKMWSLEGWNNHVRDTINEACNDFKNKLQRKVFVLLIIIIVAAEAYIYYNSYNYFINNTGENIKLVMAVVLAVSLIAEAIVQIRNILMVYGAIKKDPSNMSLNLVNIQILLLVIVNIIATITGTLYFVNILN